MPCLWDKKTHTIVNNESSEIIRMFYTAFDDFLDPHLREANKDEAGLYPAHLRSEIDSMNEWVYNTINNGVYKCGFAASQEAYDSNIYPMFKSLDRLEAHLGDAAHQPYLFGEHITEADVRLYTTLARFDVAYYTIFQCNLKMIRHDYPRLHRWLRTLYWDTSDKTNNGAFKNTTFFEVYKYGYLRAKGRQTHGGEDVGWTVVIPRGPVPDMMPLEEDEDGDDKTNGATTGMSSLGVLDGKDGVAKGNGERYQEETGSAEANPANMVAHGDENKKWYKAAKKAEKKSGVPNIHLAQA